MSAPPGARRRSWLNEPGEALFLSGSGVEDLSRADALEQQTGLDPSDVVLSRLCSVPLPSPEVPHGEENRPWVGFDPEFVWHPFAWLTERLRTRLPIPGATYADDGSQVFENDDQFAARVALELSASGLYDVETGTWLDVMSLVDIDLDTPAGMERVQAWLGGEYDFDLDTLGLAVYTDVPADPDWAQGVVLDLADSLMPASMCKAAQDLIEVVRCAVDDEPATDLAFSLHIVALSAVYSFCTIGIAETHAWRAEAAYAQQTRDQTSLRVLADSMRNRLTAIVESNRAALDKVAGYFADADSPDSTAAVPSEPFRPVPVSANGHRGT